MREAQLIGGVNLADRVFSKNDRMDRPSELLKVHIFMRTFAKFREPPATPIHREIRLFSFFSTHLFIIYTRPIKDQLEGSRLICKMCVIKLKLPRRLKNIVS